MINVRVLCKTLGENGMGCPEMRKKLMAQKYKIFRLFDAALVRQDCFFGPGACSLKSLEKSLIYHRFLIDWGVTFFLLIFWLLLRGSV